MRKTKMGRHHCRFNQILSADLVFFRPVALFSIFVLIGIVLAGCFRLRGSRGGGETSFDPPRKISPRDIALPDGYRIEPVATELTFPTGVTFDEEGRAYVVESGYSYGEVWTTPRLLRIDPAGITVIASGGKNGPWNGVAYHQGAFYVAEGGTLLGGRILKITPDGTITPLIENLPSMGDHHTNGPAIGPDGSIYFMVGTFTNSGIVGEDNAQYGWLARYPEAHDIPCRDITLSGTNYISPDPRTPDPKDTAATGAFSPFGVPTLKGQVISGKVPCSGALLRISTNGGEAELIAWGFRNPFGIAFSPDGQLFVSENSYDVRGSRPVFGTGDLLWRVEEGRWYGWPDYHGFRRLNQGEHFTPPGEKSPHLLLAERPNDPPEPVAVLGVHSSSNGFDFSRNPQFGYAGQAFIAQFGDQAPVVGKVLSPVGFKVVRVDVTNGVIHDFAVNRGKTNGPASRIGGGGLERPVAARFNPDGTALYVVDFGVMTMGQGGEVRIPFAEPNANSEPRKGTGVLWRITRAEGSMP